MYKKAVAKSDNTLGSLSFFEKVWCVLMSAAAKKKAKTKGIRRSFPRYKI